MDTPLAPMEIIVIPATITAENPFAPKRQKCVAAYCRVSTDEEDQENSLENQKEYYTDMIASNSEWAMAGIFADPGISGTSTKKRDGFLKMINLCTKGKIDIIITKSISRFARNTVDCLHYVRLLKSMGIPVIFEKESLDTSKIPNEMLLTILSWFAQAESESISANVTWGIQRSMQKGKVNFNFKHFLGYERGADGKPQIVESEAEIIHRIFNRYLAGDSLGKIKKDLENDGIRTKTGKIEWTTGGIRSILNQEKYTGDSLLQKTYVVDVLSHKVKKNLGEKPQYLVKNSHPGIIDHATYHLVQEEMARRSSKRRVSDKATTELSKYSSLYALTALLICGDCGTPYKRVTWARNGKKKIVWRCVSRLDYGTKYCENSPSLEESVLHNAIIAAVNAHYCGDDGTKEMVVGNLRAAMTEVGASGIDIIALERRNEQLGKEIGKLTQTVPIDYDKFKEISDKINTNKEQIQKYRIVQSANAAANGRLKKICNAIEAMTADLTEWDDSLIRSLIHTVKVISGEKILVMFRDGIEIEQNL